MVSIKMKENCIIVGAGTYGQVYAEYLKEDYNILGFIDDDELVHNTKINGVIVLGKIDFLETYKDFNTRVFVSIGNPDIRIKLLNKVRKLGFITPNYIDRSCNIHPSVQIGNKAVYILQGTIIMPLTKIENDVMISSGTIISHHSLIKSGTFISFGVNVGASLEIDTQAYLGIGSVIMTGVKKIGKNATIGAGAVIIKDVPDGATVVGNPGRIIKQK